MTSDPAYELLILPTAERQLRRLPNQVRRRIIDKIDLLAHEPRPSGVRPKSLPGTYRLRVGDYRVLYRIEILRVVVVKVGHRRDVYR